jgi:DNA-binding ferritin-like protein
MKSRNEIVGPRFVSLHGVHPAVHAASANPVHQIGIRCNLSEHTAIRKLLSSTDRERSEAVAVAEISEAARSILQIAVAYVRISASFREHFPFSADLVDTVRDRPLLDRVARDCTQKGIKNAVDVQRLRDTREAV